VSAANELEHSGRYFNCACTDEYRSECTFPTSADRQPPSHETRGIIMAGERAAKGGRRESANVAAALDDGDDSKYSSERGRGWPSVCWRRMLG
jgi:hypothetical protein